MFLLFILLLSYTWNKKRMFINILNKCLQMRSTAWPRQFPLYMEDLYNYVHDVFDKLFTYESWATFGVRSPEGSFCYSPFFLRHDGRKLFDKGCGL